MARRIHLEPHLSTAELERRYRQAKDGLLRGWWQILWLLARGQTAKAIAESTGYSRSWIGQLARALQRTGPGRHARPIAGSPVSGTPTRGAHRLAARPAGALGRAGGGVAPGAPLERPAGRALERAGGRRVDEPAAWPPGALSARLGLPHPPGRASARPPPTARPRRSRRAGSVQKKLRPLLRQVKAAFPQASVEVWAMDSRDDHRVGLKPIVRKVWVFDGRRPIAPVQHRYEWRSVAGYVHPASGPSP